ncbi:RTA1-domain-containing protein [Dothidotthia symphoricarpi CBS 119687]|uniref:RTA1-domain-containing protein n=1 Tax=Dothidotthia symphoricarpi CBS 119687 TaxID=1392245 RepID=A0A6A6AWG0_9PLEO|nr:RTA1-domain-containing protein [Dothidotthia symphoricarpi CBS 119687]KAF2134861.1 RTA1-domain-containing protein [Dothidotthia symphoricarpi CBS 119687]
MDPQDWPGECTYDQCNPEPTYPEPTYSELSYWAYNPSLAANWIFCILFGLSTVAFLTQGIFRKGWLSFTIAMTAGCVLEVVGYIGRIMAHNGQYKETPFLIQIVCLTIAPAFFAAGIYLCLSRIILAFGADISRIKPLSYPRIFIPCDIVSLLLQATGGGIASVKTHNDDDPKTGNDIMLAGLAVQVFTLLVFILLAVDFAFRTTRRVCRHGASSALDPAYSKLRKLKMFKGFLVALTFSTLCVFTRCVFRVAELSDGWGGYLMKTQRYFIGLEGAIIIAAVLALNMFHPGFCFGKATGVTTKHESPMKGVDGV